MSCISANRRSSEEGGDGGEGNDAWGEEGAAVSNGGLFGSEGEVCFIAFSIFGTCDIHGACPEIERRFSCPDTEEATIDGKSASWQPPLDGCDCVCKVGISSCVGVELSDVPYVISIVIFDFITPAWNLEVLPDAIDAKVCASSLSVVY